MALLPSVSETASNVSQPFGAPSLTVASLEPAMYVATDRAYWNPFPRGSFRAHFHPGIDRSAPLGTAVRAMEDGLVVFAGFDPFKSGGWKIEVEIRENTRYNVNHLSKILVRTGQKVRRGDTIGLVGCSGSCSGPHCHEAVSIRQVGTDGVERTFLYDPAVFLPGGRLASSPLIKPLPSRVKVNGPGINIRLVPPDLGEVTNVFAVTTPDGIFRRSTGNRLGSLEYEFGYVRWLDTSQGRFARVTGFGKQLAIHKSLVHFTN